MEWQGLRCVFAATLLLLVCQCACAKSAAEGQRRAMPTVPIPFDDIYTFNYTPGSRVTEVLEVLRNDFNPDDGTALTLVGVTDIAPPLLGQLSFTGRAITYRVENYDGFGNTDYFDYTVRDSRGRLGTGTVAVNLIATAVPFDAVADTFRFQYPAGSSPAREVLEVLSNDVGTGLRIVKATPVGSMVGTLQTTANARSILYSIGQYTGVTLREQFVYDVTDAANRTTKPALVTIDVSALPGTALAVNPDTFNFTAVTGQIVNQVLQVLSNDQGDEMRLIPAPSGAAITPFPPRSTLQGTITRSGNVLIYQALFTGVAFTDRFRYRVEDVSGQSGSAVVTVNVATAQATPRPPLARDDTFAFTVNSGRTFSANLSTVLSNDYGDGIYISFVSSAGSTVGVPSIAGNGRFLVYTVQQYNGATITDVFTYRITDRNGATSTATVMVSVSPSGPSPSPARPVLARDDVFNFNATAGTTFTVNLTSLLNNDDGELIYISLVASAGSTVGIARIAGKGVVLTYTIQQYTGATFTDRFTYRITDRIGATSTATVAIAVSPASGQAAAVRAVPDEYQVQLDDNGNLARRPLNVKENDTGIGLKITSYSTSNFFGRIEWDKANDVLYYTVSDYFGGPFVWFLNYTIMDVNFWSSSSQATIRVELGPSPPFKANDDTYNITVAPNSVLARPLFVMNNDLGDANELAGYDDTIQNNVGSLEVSADKLYVVYKVSGGANMGRSFTDRFQYVIVQTTDTSVPRKQKTALLTVNVRVA